jgi:hypothetical protein
VNHRNTPGPGRPADPKIIACTGKEKWPESTPPVACPACFQPILPGQIFTRIPLGPGSDPEKRERARSGAPFNSVTAALHWACVTGDESESMLSLT